MNMTIPTKDEIKVSTCEFANAQPRLLGLVGQCCCCFEQPSGNEVVVERSDDDVFFSAFTERRMADTVNGGRWTDLGMGV